MHNLFYKRQLHGQINMGEKNRNGKQLALNEGCHFENLKPYQN
jgi:hypothetical protein